MRTHTLGLPFSSARFTSALAPADHPLFHSLVTACRKGDLESVKRLVANGLYKTRGRVSHCGVPYQFHPPRLPDVPINARDAFDATPLYYASLTGREDIVRFLLQAGAQADPATFEGERTLYAALNDKIRNVLRSHKFQKRLDERQDFALWLNSLASGTRLLHSANYSSPEEADFPPDFVFHLSDEQIPAHRFLLAARSPYFCANLATRWKGKNYARVRSRVDIEVFRACIKWFYTGFADDNVNEELYPEWIKVAGQLKLDELKKQVEALQKLAEERAAWEKEHPGRSVRLRLGDRGLTGKVEGIMAELGFLAGCILAASQGETAKVEELARSALPAGDLTGEGPLIRHTGNTGTLMTSSHAQAHAHISSPAGRRSTQPSPSHTDIQRLAHEIAALRSNFPPITDPLAPTPPPEPSSLVSQIVIASAPDTVLTIGPRDQPSTLLCHRGVLRSRSPYFSAMLSGGFVESMDNTPDGIHRIRLEEPADPRVATSILHFLYSDCLYVPQDPVPSIHDLLPAPCLLLLPRLTSLVASYILHPSREKSWTRRDILLLLENAERLGVGRVEGWATMRVGSELEWYLFPGEDGGEIVGGEQGGGGEEEEEEEETLREALVRMIADSAEWVREREEEDSVPVGCHKEQ